MKRAGDPTTLSVKWWSGPWPQCGDALRTTTGRRYMVLRQKLGRDSSLKALECLVLAPADKVEGRTFEWRWSPRVSKLARRR